jgi:hypothetical protein
MQASQDILTALVMDICNTGLMVYYNAGAAAVDQRAVVSPTAATLDSSSFIHKQGNDAHKNDTLTILKSVLNSGDGSLGGADTVKYLVNGKDSLLRIYRNSSGSKDTTVVAGNVSTLQFEYGISQVTNTSVLDEDPVAYANWTNSANAATMSKGSNNSIVLKFAGTSTGSLSYNATVAVKANRKYSVKLGIAPTAAASNFLDSMRFAFKNGGTVIGSGKFFPRTDTFQMVVPVSTAANATIALDYSAKGTGTVLFRTLEVTCVDSGAYTWVSNPSVEEKERTRALRVHLLTREDAGVKMSGTRTIVDATISLSGKYSWREYDNIIEIPNNGVFPVAGTTTYGLNPIDYEIRPTLLSVQY